MTNNVAAILEQWRTLDVNQEGLTVQEIIKKTGRGADWIRRRIREAIDAGTMEACTKNTQSISQRNTKVPAYRMVSKKKAK